MLSGNAASVKTLKKLRLCSVPKMRNTPAWVRKKVVMVVLAFTCRVLNNQAKNNPQMVAKYRETT